MVRTSIVFTIIFGWSAWTLAADPVDFDSQIKPILQARCLNCHAKGKYKGGLSLESREAVLKGGESGPAVVPGQGEASLLVELVAGFDPDRRMPDKGDPLSKEQVGLIRAWVDQ